MFYGHHHNFMEHYVSSVISWVLYIIFAIYLCHYRHAKTMECMTGVVWWQKMFSPHAPVLIAVSFRVHIFMAKIFLSICLSTLNFIMFGYWIWGCHTSIPWIFHTIKSIDMLSATILKFYLCLCVSYSWICFY